MLKCHFENLATHTGSKKHVNSIYVKVQILKYIQHKLGIAENCIMFAQAHCIILMYHIARNVTYKLS